MTVQAERPVVTPGERGPKSRKRRGIVAVVGLALVAAGGTATAIGFGHSEAGQPNPVLGRALQPLPVYRVEVPGTPSGQHQATMHVSDLGRPAHSSNLDRVPSFTLHVQYAHVRQVAGRWQIEVTAPEGQTFNVDTTQGQFYDVLINGQAANLFFVAGTQAPGPDHGTNFAFGGGPNSMSRDAAVALAHTLTTSVRVG
jgi:hypothetical protein